MSDTQNKASSGFTHEKVETSNFLMIVLILLVVAVGGLVEIVPLFFQKSTTEPVQGIKPRHLPARGLLQLPFADDPPVPRRDAALRPLLGGG
jgi:flagellar basal body-associated protein FliL